ncbi:MAG: hypothetical protein P4L46_15470 [Fimbriimonas sp.]|nr:hypothetical protein [Fimbriimonas sp.]
MTPTPTRRHGQQAIIFVALLLFCLVLVTIQLWLFVGSLEAHLRGNRAMSIPAAIISATVFGLNAWMYFGVRRIERQDL